MRLQVGFVTTEKTDGRETLELQANGTRIGRLWIDYHELDQRDPKSSTPRVRGVGLLLDEEVDVDG